MAASVCASTTVWSTTSPGRMRTLCRVLIPASIHSREPFGIAPLICAQGSTNLRWILATSVRQLSCVIGAHSSFQECHSVCNAPATFQHLMDNFETCLVYLDDIIVFSHDLPSHLERLQKLFQHLREANLKLKPSKCHLLQRRVIILGFTVSQSGIGTDPEKIRGVRDWPVHVNLKRSRSFVGLCQYYRRFVPTFSDIAAPLHALTKKGARFEWAPECQSSFDRI